MKDALTDLSGDAARAAPPWFLWLIAKAGEMDLQGWFLLVSLLYTGLLAAHRLWHWKHPPGRKQ